MPTDAGPFVSGLSAAHREPTGAAMHSHPLAPRQIYLRVTLPTGNSKEAKKQFTRKLPLSDGAPPLQKIDPYSLSSRRRPGSMAAMGTGRSRSSGRPKAGPVGRCDK